MKQTQLAKRELRENAVIGIQNLKDSEEFANIGETMEEFFVDDGTVIEFPVAEKFAAWTRMFRGHKVPYISGLQTSNDEVWLDIPASIFRNSPIQEDMDEFRTLNEFGMLLRSKDKDLFRWEELAGKKVRLAKVSLRAPGYDKETNSRITDPDKCKTKVFYKLTLL